MPLKKCSRCGAYFSAPGQPDDATDLCHRVPCQNAGIVDEPEKIEPVIGPVPVEPKEGTQQATILRMLREAGEHGVTNAQFVAVPIFRYSARIEELRREGRFNIETGATGEKGLVRYTLMEGE